MSAALFDLPGTQEPAPVKWTERMMLDLLAERHAKSGGNGPRYVFAEHVRSAAGFGAWSDRDLRAAQGGKEIRTADAMAIDLWPSANNVVHGFEIKVSRSDWLTELKDPTKADAIRRYCDHWWLVVPDASIVRGDLPEGWGLLVVGRNGQLRVKQQAPRLCAEPMTPSFIAALARAIARTATRIEAAS